MAKVNSDKEANRVSVPEDTGTVGSPEWVSRGGMSSTTLSGGTIWLPVIAVMRWIWRKLRTR